jgi:hypothetical protein
LEIIAKHGAEQRQFAQPVLATEFGDSFSRDCDVAANHRLTLSFRPGSF